jgi:hypothetical protein
MTPVTLSEEAKSLLRARMASSGINRPFARIALQEPEGDAKRASNEDDADWTINRRDLWTLLVAEDESIADGDPRLVLVDGLIFVSDFFPIRFEISVKDGQFRVAASA